MPLVWQQVVRAKAASEVFEAILRSKGKRLAGMVKKIPKADKDGFLQQVEKFVQSRPWSPLFFVPPSSQHGRAI